jgi:hypothetical protein
MRSTTRLTALLIWAGIVEDPANPRMKSKVSLKRCRQPSKTPRNRPTYFATSSRMSLNDRSTRKAGEQVESSRARQPPLEYTESSYHSVSAPEGGVVPRAFVAAAFIAAKNSSPQNRLTTWDTGLYFGLLVPPPHCNPPVLLSEWVSSTTKTLAGTPDRLDLSMNRAPLPIDACALLSPPVDMAAVRVHSFTSQ